MSNQTAFHHCIVETFFDGVDKLGWNCITYNTIFKHKIHLVERNMKEKEKQKTRENNKVSVQKSLNNQQQQQHQSREIAKNTDHTDHTDHTEQKNVALYTDHTDHTDHTQNKKMLLSYNLFLNRITIFI